MGMIAPQDAAFLLGESREHPTHVGFLQLFELPEGAPESYVGDLYQELLTHRQVHRQFRLRPQTPVSTLGQLWWTEDADVDLEYHVRLTALPKPQQVRQLLELTSRLHAGLLDRHRPLWECYLIEGLEGRRFAIYTKMHHALVDGVSATRLAMGALSPDPHAACPPFWAVLETRAVTSPARATPLIAPNQRTRQLDTARRRVSSAGRITESLARLARGASQGQLHGAPVPAPRTMFNVPITGGRRFVAQAWEIERLKKVGDQHGGTLNDTVLAMCAGALRRYLNDAGELPDRPLVGAVPVSLELRGAGRSGDGGNAVAAVLCNLATNLSDPVERMRTICSSMRMAKQSLDGKSATQLQLESVMLLGGAAVVASVPGLLSHSRPLFNVVISNVPGPRTPLYLNGARMQGCYPMSIPSDGLAVNITVFSYAGRMHFGITGCRRQVPHVQRFIEYLEDSIAELEA